MCVDVRERWMGRSRFLLCCSVVPVWGIDYSGTDRRTQRRNSNMSSPSLSLFPLFLLKRVRVFFMHRSNRVFFKIHSHSHWHRCALSPSILYTHTHTPVGDVCIGSFFLLIPPGACLLSMSEENKWEKERRQKTFTRGEVPSGVCHLWCRSSHSNWFDSRFLPRSIHILFCLEFKEKLVS